MSEWPEKVYICRTRLGELIASDIIISGRKVYVPIERIEELERENERMREYMGSRWCELFDAGLQADGETPVRSSEGSSGVQHERT
jgi:hypothetical protein